MSILQWFQTRANWRQPIDKHEAQTLHLLVRLVRKMDDQQQEHGRELAVIREQNRVIIDTSNKILEFARAAFPPRSEP